MRRCGGEGLGLCAVAVLAAAMGLPTQVRGDDTPAPPHFEFWTGAQAFDHVWSLYSGASAAPFGGIQEDGLRLRAVGGYGAYSYSGPRAVGLTSQVVKFHGASTFTDLLVGYHKQLGPVTVKAFAGFMQADYRLSPDDPETSIRGAGFGGKAALETWWTISEVAWSSVDVSWGSLHDTYAGRARLGWRVLPALSIGLEAAAAGNVEGDLARGGGFVRYEWTGGEVSVSGGASNDKLLEGGARALTAKSSVPFATFSWLTRF